MTVTARAPAKVNVHLGVGPLRADGFHDLRTVYLAVYTVPNHLQLHGRMLAEARAP